MTTTFFTEDNVGFEVELPPHAYSPIAAAIAIGVAQISFLFIIYLSRVGDRRRECRKAF
ncbi:hypothetical protein BCAR13_1610015 [Paraburkholderia caribensis]|nr:hypothetical protein BCAR13_1610015 [Paraburkholderia caribensis]